MAKRLYSGRDFQTVGREPLVMSLEMDEFQTAAVRNVIGSRRRFFPLLSRLVEEDYGPEGDISFLPTQLQALAEEIRGMDVELSAKDLKEELYAFGRARVSVSDIRGLLARLLAMTEGAMSRNESLFGFAD